MDKINVLNARTQYLDTNLVFKIINAYNVYQLVAYASRHKLFQKNNNIKIISINIVWYPKVFLI